MRKVLKIIFDIGTYALIAVLVIFGLPKFLKWALNSDFPMAAITSGSMWPTLKVGDLVFIQGIGAKDQQPLQARRLEYSWKNPIPRRVITLKDESDAPADQGVIRRLEFGSNPIPQLAMILKFGSAHKKENFPSIKVGDIVVYRNKSNNTFTIHRVIKVDKMYFTTKGDANFQEDPPARYEDLIGKAFTLFGRPVHIPYLGSITVFANNLKQ
ncbi:MAG: hypothetical protein ACK4NX_00930 [Candidatus Paceibacteria bacterium]